MKKIEVGLDIIQTVNGTEYKAFVFQNEVKPPEDHLGTLSGNTLREVLQKLKHHMDINGWTRQDVDIYGEWDDDELTEDDDDEVWGMDMKDLEGIPCELK